MFVNSMFGPRRGSSAFTGVLALLAVFLASPALFGQGAVVNLTVSKDTVWVGESFLWTATSSCTFAVPTLNVNFGDGTVTSQMGNTVSGSHAYASAGVFTMTATDMTCGGSDTVIMTVNACPSLSLLTSSLPDAVQGTAYSFPLQASGGLNPLAWSVSGSLPPGLALNASTGQLFGTPTVPGTYGFTVSVQDSCSTVQRVSRGLSLVVQPSCPPLAVATLSLPAAQQGTAYSALLQASGGLAPLTWSVTGGSLPPGLSLNGAAGMISGVPSQTGAFSFTVQVQDSCSPPQRAAQGLTLTVEAGCPSLAVATASLPLAGFQSPYQAALTASGGVPPMQWSLVGGRLPQGMVLSSGGVLSGTPSESGQFVLTVQVRDACPRPGPQSASAVLTLQVAAPDVTITAAPAGFAVSPQAEARVPVTYAFMETHGFSLALASSAYRVTINGAEVLQVPQPLSATLAQGRGYSSEIITLPAEVIQRAREAGAAFLEVSRTFESGAIPWTVRMQAVLAGEAAAPFAVRRVMVSFEDGLGQVIVPLHREGLTASATIWVTGTGIVTGDWRVDDRVLASFSAPALFGDSIVLPSPALPTFEPGSHTVTLTLTNPVPPFPIPQISYAVEPFARSIRLIGPAEGRDVAEGDIEFTWEASGSVPSFRLVVLPENGEEPLFQALTRKLFFRLSADATRGWPVGARLRWGVVGEDGAGQRILESPWNSFRFKPMAEDGTQLVAAVLEKDAEPLRAWLKANGVDLLEEAPIATLEAIVMLLKAGSAEKARLAEAHLRKQPWVQEVTPNRLFLTQQSPPPSYAHYLYSYDEFLLGRIHKRWTGKGVRVAVIDSGVALEHPDIRANILESDDFVGTAYQGEIHGTAVAGLISGNGEGGTGYAGVAPEAGILALRACEEPDEASALALCRTWALVRALDAAVQRHARIINISIGGEPDPLVAQLIQAALKANIIVIAAAGNTGPAGSTAFPASLPQVIAVGSVGGEGTAASSSARGKVDIAAYGEDIFAPVPDGRYNFLSGTSMAAAQVSGIAALAVQIKPELSPRDLVQLLRATAANKGDSRVYGAGLIRPCEMIKALTGAAACGEP